MNIFFRFVSAIYLKNFFIVFFALVAFYVGIDLLLNFKDLPHSANLVILYILFLAFNAGSYLFPVCLVFALIISLVSIIRTNELISLHCMGLSKNRIILYPFLWAIFLCFVYIGLNCTSFAYAQDYQRSILKHSVLYTNDNKNIFFKYDDNFVFIQNYDNISNKISNIKIFNIKDNKLHQITQAASASYSDDSWHLNEVDELKLPNELVLLGPGLKESKLDQSTALNDFKPKALEGVLNDSSYHILDLFEIIKVFYDQGLNTDQLRNKLYNLAILPFFAPFLMVIVYYFFPIMARFYNITLIAFGFFVLTLLVWGMLFVIARLSQNGVIMPEFAILLPVFILSYLAYKAFKKMKGNL